VPRYKIHRPKDIRSVRTVFMADKTSGTAAITIIDEKGTDVPLTKRTIVRNTNLCFQHISDIYTAMYGSFPENKWVGRMASSFKVLGSEYMNPVCHMMACDIDNLAIELGFPSSQELLSQMFLELQANTPVTICRLQFMINISMAQMIELTSKTGVVGLCVHLGKLLSCFECYPTIGKHTSS
jgi:hypothetical protein